MKKVTRFLSIAGGLCLVAQTAFGADYKVATATILKVGDTATVGGTVVPYKEVTLAAQIPGAVMYLAGREGDTFKTGKVLVAINDTQIRAKRRAAVAALMAAQSSLRNAQVQFSREIWSPRTGRKTGMGLPTMMDKFMGPMQGNQYTGRDDPWVRRYADIAGQRSGVETAQTSILTARASIEEIDSKLRDAQLSAPFDGVITHKLVEKGDTVQPGQPLLKFAFIKYLRIRAEVPVRLVPALRKGMMVPARLDVGDLVVQARVAQIFPMADKSRHTVTVKFDLPRGVPGGPGMFADVKIPDVTSQGRPLPTVPEKAVFRRGSLPAVLILKDGKPTLRLVRIGSGVGGGRISILSGLKGGEQVILDPAKALEKSRANGK